MEKEQVELYYDVRHVEMTDSTNNYVRHIPFPPGVDFIYVATDYQTDGKGQGGNRWESERGKNLLFSFKCLPYNVKASDQYLLMQTVSVALRDVLEEYVPNKELLTIKWPNDIYYGDKKLSGTLSECSLRMGKVHEFIAGVGINVNQLFFLSDAPNPVSLAAITGKMIDRDTLLEKIIHKIAHWFRFINFGSEDLILLKYEENIYRSTGIHQYRDKDGDFLASHITIKPNGHLVLLRLNGLLSEYEFKEVKYVID